MHGYDVSRGRMVGINTVIATNLWWEMAKNRLGAHGKEPPDALTLRFLQLGSA